MNITGIIAEYNPFHNGHAYHLKRAREETNADFLIIIMSGNFVQRGAPALLDKFARTKMALLEGADLVIELPPLWSCASAEYFARAAIALFAQLGCVNTLCCGCETPASDLFSSLGNFLSHEPPAYKKLLAGFLKEGCSYARAREQAVLALLPETDAAAIMDIFENPNNTLALEYQKAIALSETDMKLYPILRNGAGHHSQNLSGTFSSASAIRRFLSAAALAPGQPNIPGGISMPSGNADSTGFLDHMHPHIRHTIGKSMPASSCRLLLRYVEAYPLLFENDCSQMLHYALLKNAASGYAGYADCGKDFSNKIRRNLDAYTNFTDFCALLKSKNRTYTRISRVLLHILLDIRQDDYACRGERAFVPYARILGFRQNARELFPYLKKHADIPLLTRAAAAKNMFTDPRTRAFFEKNMFADAVYRALVLEKGGQPMRDEYRSPIVIV